jgi:hypothetical protein
MKEGLSRDRVRVVSVLVVVEEGIVAETVEKEAGRVASYLSIYLLLREDMYNA